MFKKTRHKTKKLIKYVSLGATCFTVVVASYIIMTYRQSKQPPKDYSRPIDF